MRQTKRKIVALTTAFVMAFALVAAMLPATVSEAASISQVNITIKVPNAGDAVKKVEPPYFDPTMPWYEQDPKPEISTTTAGINESDGFWLTTPELVEGSQDNYFFGTFEAGQTVYLNGYAYSEADTFPEDVKVTINGGELVSATGDGTHTVYFTAKVTIPGGGGGSTEPVPVKEGDNQTVAPGSPVVISFDKEFSKFENGGAVFLDDSTEPLSTDCYTATSGSTVITLLDSFTKTLPEGTHTLKVKFNDDSVGTASFIVSASANSDGSASGTSGTATSGTSSSAATTTKVAAPKTADVLPFAAIAVVFVGATAIGVIAFRRKNS